MGKEKIKIRYIIFVLITMGVIFFGKITRLDNLNAEKIAGIILVSPPYKKRITKWPGQRSHYINGNIPI